MKWFCFHVQILLIGLVLEGYVALAAWVGCALYHAKAHWGMAILLLVTSYVTGLLFFAVLLPRVNLGEKESVNGRP